MTDSIIALEMSLIANGYIKKDPAPLNPIHQELLDYVNSPKYKELNLKEYNTKVKQRRETMMTQFKGENRKDAIVEYYVLDIEEEESFFDFIKEMGYTVEDEDRIINGLYKMWRDKNDN